MASIMAYVCGVLVQKFNARARQRYLATATGEYLNALGETFDIERPEPTHAVCQVTVTASSGRNYDISAPAGTFFISDNNGWKPQRTPFRFAAMMNWRSWSEIWACFPTIPIWNARCEKT